MFNFPSWLVLAVLTTSSVFAQTPPSNSSESKTESSLKTSASSTKNSSTQSVSLASALDTDFTNKDYASAANLIQKSDPKEAIPILQQWASHGSVPAMWMLGKELAEVEDLQGSANWIYAGVLGVRLDASICLNQETGTVEQQFINAYWSIVQSARVLPHRMSVAIDFAIEFFKNNNLQTLDSPWVCRLKPAIPYHGRLQKEAVGLSRRNWVYKDFIKASSAEPDPNDIPSLDMH